MYIVGSKTLLKEGEDWDVVLEDGETLPPSDERADISPPDLETLSVCREYEEGTMDTPWGIARTISPVGVMLMKRSHLHRPLKFSKHIRDYHSLYKQYNHLIDDKYRALLARRISLTKAKYGDKHPKLNMSKEQFFDDYVKKVYIHDDLHYATCYGDRPVYEELKDNHTTVWCQKSKWDTLSHEKKIQCVREECFVIALERYIIPDLTAGQPHMPSRFAFSKALERVCTTLTSGYFRDFAIDNWPEISNNTVDFLSKFKAWASTKKEQTC